MALAALRCTGSYIQLKSCDLMGSIWGSTLKRNTPLRAKKEWELKAKPERKKFTDLKKTPLKKVSKSQRRRLSEYYPLQHAFLKENPACMICAVRGIAPRRATEVHHIRGRAGSLLTDRRFWASSCRACRDFPHDNPRRARELGILAEACDWNVPVR